MTRKSFLQELGGYSNDFSCQDGYELWIKMSKYKKVRNINLPLFYYRKHGKNLTENKERLYNTRHKIIKKNLKLSNIEKKNHLALIPIRDEDENSWFLKPFLGSILIDITLKNLLASNFFKKIIVTTPNIKILEHLKKNYKSLITCDKRPVNLAMHNTLIDETVNHIIQGNNVFDVAVGLTCKSGETVGIEFSAVSKGDSWFWFAKKQLIEA